MRLVIAISGPSAVGKSTVGRLVAKALGAELRSCGELVKTRAECLGVSLDDLASEEHQRIDEETIELAQSAQVPIVIEGRYLEKVLHDVRDIFHVCLRCDDQKRAQRSAMRNGAKLDALTTLGADLQYVDISMLVVRGKVAIDSSEMTAVETTKAIFEQWASQKHG